VPARFVIGHGYASYRGPTTTGTMHRHGAFQVVIGIGCDATMVDGDGVTHRASTLVVAPMARHSLQAAQDVQTFFVEPQCVFADGLRERHGHGVTAAPELDGLSAHQLDLVGAAPSGQLDPRLMQALNALADTDIALPELAARVGLSPQRLRTLARAQLGMSLARLRVWIRLRHAATVLQDGRSLADAASAAGFADQAHLTRQMREMMGLTPATVLPVLRSQGLRAT
jgi:AraC-like DNA-binding protein